MADDVDTVQAAIASEPYLGDGEKAVLEYLAHRLALGAKAYGPINLASDQRNFVKERRDELADALVYSAFAMLRGEIDHERALREVQAKCTAQHEEIAALKRELAAANVLIAALERSDGC